MFCYYKVGLIFHNGVITEFRGFYQLYCFVILVAQLFLSFAVIYQNVKLL